MTSNEKSNRNLFSGIWIYKCFHTLRARARARTHTHTYAQSSTWHEYFSYRNFRRACCLRFYGLRCPTISQSTRHHSPENFRLYQHVCENLKSRTNITESFVCSWSVEQCYIKGTFYRTKNCCAFISSKRLKYSELSCCTLGYTICVGWELRHGARTLRIADVQTKITTGDH
jgi:hypothetical protein